MSLKTLIDISAGTRLPQYEQEIFSCDELARYYLNKLCEQYDWYRRNSARDAYYYAYEVLKGRWPEAEPVIAKDAAWAYSYAMTVIKGRWPEAEPTIVKCRYYRVAYNDGLGANI